MRTASTSWLFPWASTTPPRRAAAGRPRFLVHVEEPTFNSVHSAQGRNLSWSMVQPPTPAELNKWFAEDASLVQGSTLVVYDILGGSIVVAFIKRNSNGLPLWKPLQPPAAQYWPARTSGLFQPGNQWTVPVPSPAWSGT